MTFTGVEETASIKTMTKSVQNNPAFLDILVLHKPKILFEREIISTFKTTSLVWEVKPHTYKV